MVQSVQGVFRDGRVELLEPSPVSTETRVIVTFLPDRKAISLAEHGIMPEEAAQARVRLACFEEDWMRPEMDVYDEM